MIQFKEMKKKLYLFSCLLFITFTLPAQIRSTVCIVRPVYKDQLKETILSYESIYGKMGVKRPREFLENYINMGSFGSGFVYVGPDGKNYIITNQHVINDADTAIVEFTDVDNDESVKYENLKIVAADIAMDLAILEFADDIRPFKSGLKLHKGEIQDGDSVYSAGYPGVMGKPVWQFGTGIITNSKVILEELMNPDLSYIIQHSAQIDCGNSGGPLLIRTKNKEMEIVGVNTWKLLKRKDTYYSIPSSTVEKFLENVFKNKNYSYENAESIINNKATKLYKVLNAIDYSLYNFNEYISNDYIINEGVNSFNYVIKNGTKEDRTNIYNIFRSESTIEGLKYSVLMNIYYTFYKYIAKEDHKNKREKDVYISNPVKIENTDLWSVKIYNTFSRCLFVTEWAFSNGDWKVNNFYNTKMTSEDKKFFKDMQEKYKNKE